MQNNASGGQATWTASREYDGYYGRPKAQTAPNGERVWLRYSSYGHLTLESDANGTQNYRQLSATDARGQATGETYGNGLSATRSYWPASGQVREISYDVQGCTSAAGAGCAGAASNGRKLNYQYDVFGNLTRQELGNGQSIEQLSYDRLHRLTQTTRSGSASGTVTYGYDAAGNFQYKSDYSTTSLSAYGYTGGLGGGGPNAVKTVALKAGGTRSYGYDASGNLTADNAGFIGKYDHANLPVLLKRNTVINQFAYGPDNAKARQWGSDGIRLYAPGYEQLGTGESKAYIGNYLVISKSGSTRTLRFLLTDRLGSVDAITTESGTLVETRGYDAFGAPRTGTWADASPPKLASTAITPKGFTQHEHLNTLELIHMNGRSYDYKLGRFMGVDPFIQFPANSQSLNPYSYILNNPLSGTDPTGYVSQNCASDPDCTKQPEPAPEKAKPLPGEGALRVKTFGTRFNASSANTASLGMAINGAALQAIKTFAQREKSQSAADIGVATKEGADPVTSNSGGAHQVRGGRDVDPNDGSSFQKRKSIVDRAFSLRGVLGVKHRADDQMEYHDYYNLVDRRTGTVIPCKMDCDLILNDPEGRYTQMLAYYDDSNKSASATMHIFRGAVSAYPGASFFYNKSYHSKYATLNLSPLEHAISVVSHESAHGMGADRSLAPDDYHPAAERAAYDAVMRWRSLQSSANGERQ